MKALIAAALAALVLPAAGGAHKTKFSWTEFDASQRLTVGRFAAANAVKYATCLGNGAATGPAAGSGARPKFVCTSTPVALSTRRRPGARAAASASVRGSAARRASRSSSSTEGRSSRRMEEV